MYSSFSWDNNPRNNKRFNWKKGSLKHTLNNVDDSGVAINFELSGETDALCSWSRTSRSISAPEIGKNLSKNNNLQMYTRGFKTKKGIALNIDFSEGVSNAFFTLLNVNKYFKNGSQFIITGKTTSEKTVYPKLTKVANSSYSVNSKSGVVDATKYVIGRNATLGVAFLDSDKIKSIRIEWKDCSTCSKKNAHGFGMSGITFNKQIIDTDQDGIKDAIDIDDDNDGILDRLESSYKTIKKNTALGTPLFTAFKGVDYRESITDGINYKGAKFNSIKDELVINFGKKYPLILL